MKKLCLLFLLLNILLKAQPPTRFYTAFGGDGDDIAYSAKTTLDKAYIIAGNSSSWGTHGNTDAFLVKLDTMGQQLWQKMIGGLGNEAAKSIIQLPDSSFVMAGYTNSFGAGGYDAYIIKTDKAGNLIWQTTYGGTNWDFANDLVLASDGNIIITGYTYSFGSGEKDGFLIKYDQGGNLLWQKFFGGERDDELRSVIKTDDNNIVAVGYTESTDSLGDGLFLKLNLNGDTLFTRTFGGPYKDYANDVVQKSNGDYVLCGAKTYTAGIPTHALMYSISSTGAFLWENHYSDRPEDDAFVSLSNSYQWSMYTGYVKPRPIPSYKLQVDIYVAIPGGYTHLVNASGGFEDEYVYSVEGTPDGGYICAGSTASFNSIGKNIYFIKLDTTIVNYVSIVGIPQIKQQTNVNVVYTDDLITISFSDREPRTVAIYDLTGNTIYRSTTDEAKLELSISDLSSSIYVLRISAEKGPIYNGKFIRR